MQQLLESGADSTATDCNLHRTALEWAVLQGHTSLVQLLFQRETFGVTRKNSTIYLSLLDYAIWREDRVIVKKVHEWKEIKNPGGVSELLPIYVPAQAGYVDIVRKSLQTCAAIEAKPPDRENSITSSGRERPHHDPRAPPSSRGQY